MLTRLVTCTCSVDIPQRFILAVGVSLYLVYYLSKNIVSPVSTIFYFNILWRSFCLFLTLYIFTYPDVEILRNFGGLDSNNLCNILQSFHDNDDMPIDLNNKISHYYSCDVAIETLRYLNDSFCLLSLNCQRLNAKFDKLVLLIEHLKLHNFAFSAISLQEMWLEGDADHICPRANIVLPMVDSSFIYKIITSM